MFDRRFGRVFLRLLDEFSPAGRLDAFVPLLFHLGPILDHLGGQTSNVFLGIGGPRPAHCSQQSGNQTPRVPPAKASAPFPPAGLRVPPGLTARSRISCRCSPRSERLPSPEIVP